MCPGRAAAPHQTHRRPSSILQLGAPRRPAQLLSAASTELYSFHFLIRDIYCSPQLQNTSSSDADFLGDGKTYS